MRFQVPQFIEIEDKIFGPFTLRQFIYLAGSAGIVVILFAVLPRFLALLASAPVAALGAALAFLKVNERPFIETLESAFSYLLRSRLYLWKKRDREIIAKKQVSGEQEHNALLKVPALSGSKLKDLAWSLDIKESIYSDESQR